MRIDRLNELTAIRGIAAISVVLLHAQHEWHAVFHTGERYTNVISAGGIWVHFFFVLSGFVISHAYGSEFQEPITSRRYFRFMWIRLGRIYPLYIGVLLVWVLCHRAGYLPVNDPPGSLFASIFLLQGFTYGDDVWNYPGWSISAEWFAYLAFPFINLLLSRVGWHATWLLTFVLSIFIVALFGFAPSIGLMPMMGLIYCLLEFTFGSAVFRLTKGDHSSESLPIARATIISLAPLILIALPPNHWSNWIEGLAAVTCGSTILLIATRRVWFDPLLNSRALQFLGMISYSVYLNHALVFRLTKSVINEATERSRTIETLSSGAALFAFAGYLVVLLFISTLTYRYIEEPARVWFKQVALRMRVSNR